MELSLQLAYEISKKNIGACVSLIRVWWFKIPFNRLLKNFQITGVRNILLLFPKSTYCSVNKRREHLSAEGVFVKQHLILPTDEQGKVKVLYVIYIYIYIYIYIKYMLYC